MTSMKIAELTSGLGALVLGVGLGAFFSPWLGASSGPITIAGLLVHAFGMWDKHRLESLTTPENPPWVAALYWICWLLLAAVLAALVLWSR